MSNRLRFQGVFIAVMCIVLCVATSCVKKPQSVQEAVETVYNVEVTKVKTSSITEYHRFGGTLKAKNSVSAMPEAAGKIVQVLVTEGDRVERDAVLGYVDPSRAGQNYKLSPVKAPISGTVTSVSAKEGMMTSQAAPFATVETLDNLELKFSAIERYAVQMQAGSEVSVTFDALPNEVFTAKIVKISSTVSPMSRMSEVTVKLDKNDPRLKAGMYARLSVEMEKKNDVVTAPYSAFTVAEKETYCYVDNGGKAVRTVVTLGIKEGGMVEVLSGLRAGDSLVTKGQGFLSDGNAIKVLN